MWAQHPLGAPPDRRPSETSAGVLDGAAKGRGQLAFPRLERNSARPSSKALGRANESPGLAPGAPSSSTPVRSHNLPRSLSNGSHLGMGKAEEAGPFQVVASTRLPSAGLAVPVKLARPPPRRPVT